jgi:5-methylcytosine-specific restriction endonuclease McrA
MRRNGTRQFNHDEWAELKRRYRYRCVRCGRRENRLDYTTKLTADHVVPKSKVGFGGMGIVNIQPMCYRCNQEKGDQIIDYRHRRFKS